MRGYTIGPWRWEINRHSKDVKLCGGDPEGGFGRYDLTVMSFKRWGMSNAAPVFWSWAKSIGKPQRADELAVEVAGREHHANCKDCDGGGVPELCETCFPFFDKARLARRAAISKATGGGG